VEVYGPQLVLAGRSQFLRDQPEVVSRALSALIESMAFMSAPANKAAYEAEVRTALGITTSAGLEKAYRDLSNLNRRPYPSHARLVQMQGVMAENQPEIGRVDLNGVVQDGIVRELDRRGEIAALYQKYGVAGVA
jgi:hypothetical protein